MIDAINIQSALRSVSGEGQLGAVTPIPAGKPAQSPTAITEAADIGGPSFGETLSKYIDEVNHTALRADQKVAELAAGKSGDVHNALIAMQKADLQVRLLVETRNKVLSAYQEIMRMQA